MCNIGIVVDECDCRVDDRAIRLYVACTTAPRAPRVHFQVLRRQPPRLKRDFMLQHTLRLCTVFKQCYAHDPTTPVASPSQPRRFTEWHYVIPADLDCDDDTDESGDKTGDEAPGVAATRESSREYSLFFGHNNERSSTAAVTTVTAVAADHTTTTGSSVLNDDRLFLRDLFASVAETTFHFNVVRVIVRSRESAAPRRQPLRFVIHSHVHDRTTAVTCICGTSGSCC